MGRVELWRRGQRFYTGSFLVVLTSINLLNYIDRLVISGLLEPIRKDLGLNDAQLGQIALAFLATYSILPPLMGWIGDRASRKKLIASAVTLWSAATGLAGFTATFGQLAATRALVGVGEATYMSTSPSLIADLFPAARRGKAMSFFYTASPVGAAIGVTLGGLVASHYGWRVACLFVGLPGILMATILLRFQDPERGYFDAGVSAERPPFSVAARELATNRAFVLLMFAYTAQIFAYNATEFWLPTILQRDKALALVEANTMYGGVALVAGFLGPLLGGFLGDTLARRTPRGYYWICGMSVLASIFPLLAIACFADRARLFSAVFAEILVGNMNVGLVMTLVVTVVRPGLRATATAVQLVMIHLLGDAISQPLIGRVSASLQTMTVVPSVLRGPASVVGIPLEHSLSLAVVAVVIPAAVLSGFLFWVAMPKAPKNRAAATVAGG